MPLDATALINFGRISVSMNDMMVIPPDAGTLVEGPPCNESIPLYEFYLDR